MSDVLQIRIGDETYSIQDAMDATIGDLDDLETQSTALSWEPLSVESIGDFFLKIGEIADDPEFDTVTLLGAKWFRRNMVGLIFLAERGTNPDISLRDASRTKFSEIEFVAPDEVEAGPKAPEVDASPEPLPSPDAL